MKKYSVSEFANEIRNKYPEAYDDLSDEKLIEFWIKKFPNDKNKINFKKDYSIILLLILSFIFSIVSIYAFFYYDTEEYKETFGHVNEWINSQDNSTFEKNKLADINEYDNATTITFFTPMINYLILSFFYFLTIIKKKEGILNWWSLKLACYILISIFIFYVSGFISPHYLLDNYPKQMIVLLFFDLIHNYYFAKSLLVANKL